MTVLAFALGLALAGRAAAQVAVTGHLVTEERYRGRSVSQGRPAVGLDVAYDAANGTYLGLAASAVFARHEGPRPLALQEYAGYVVRLPAGPSLDLGLTHSDYAEYYSGEASAHYTELYAGLITRRLATRLSYSPNYFGRGQRTLYAEVDTAVQPARNWRLSAHAGLLGRLGGGAAPQTKPTQYDWRLGLATALRSFDVELSWSGAGPSPGYYAGAPRSRSGVALALKRGF